MRNLRENIILFLKGIAMGSADVVPGVSGGTIAFITGIYEELLTSIKSVDAKAIQLLLKFKIKDFWTKINANFLLVLLSGIAFAVLSLARLVLYLLKNEPVLLWSFFFGLVVASSIVVGKKIEKWNISSILMALLGAAIAFYITVATPAETPNQLWFIFLSGAIAICAMILPGISGSFILVLLSKYEYILSAVKDLKISVIITFMLGCLVGILSFSRLLSYMLRKHFDVTVAVLTGFMVGSLNKVYPWKKVLSTNAKGNPVLTENVLPNTYTEITGQDAQLIWAILLAILGFAVVYILEKASETPQTAHKV